MVEIALLCRDATKTQSPSIRKNLHTKCKFSLPAQQNIVSGCHVSTLRIKYQLWDRRALPVLWELHGSTGWLPFNENWSKVVHIICIITSNNIYQKYVDVSIIYHNKKLNSTLLILEPQKNFVVYKMLKNTRN
jgi:hypothetical protein